MSNSTQAKFNGKKVAAIGILPEKVDFTNYPDTNVEKVYAGIKVRDDSWIALGLIPHTIYINPEDGDFTATLGDRLVLENYDIVLIGAGVRLSKEYFHIFEQLINLVHEKAPRAKICFNTTPGDSTEALERWL